MAIVVVDTDVLIEFLRGHLPSVNQVTTLAESDRLRTTTISLFELLSGADEGSRGNVVRDLAEDLEAFSLNRKATILASKIRRNLDASGQGIGMADSLIAGICLSHGLPLLTRNRKHFTRVPDLTLYDH